MEAETVPEKTIISHRGEKYEIGRGKRFYGIWVIGAPYDAPVDRWPENADGWQQAWARFAAIEVPGTIGPATREQKGMRFRRRKAASDKNSGDSANKDGANKDGAAKDGEAAGVRSRRGSALLVGEGLLVLGVVLGLAGLFPGYYTGRHSLLSQGDQVVLHLCFVIGWALTAALAALSVARPSKAARPASLFGLGVSAVTFGLFLADWGQVSGTVKPGIGLVVSSLGWLACTAGAALAFGASGGPGKPPSRPVRPGRGHAGPAALLVLAGIGTAATFAPSWDSYLLVAKATGATQTVTAGNAFDNPGPAIAGNVCVMAAIIAVAAVAALWNPARHGALLLAGAIVPFAAQFVSALIEVAQPVSLSQFGISSAQASALRLTISPGLTGIFWVYFVFVISLLVSCAWLLTGPGHPVMPGIPAAPGQPAGEGPGAQSASAAPVREDAGSDASDDTEHDGTDSGADGVDSDTETGDGGQSAYA
ncbi:MAG: hypothetical protein ACRDNW_12270 [Trebonia sp.]